MKKIKNFVEKHRFKLLLILTLFFLVVPAFVQQGPLFKFIIFLTITSVFLQSLFIVTNRQKKYNWMFIIFFMLIFLTGLDIFFEINIYINFFRVLLYFIFFFSTILSLVRYIIKADKVTGDVLTVSVAIYLLIGVLAGSAAMFLYGVFPDAYHFAYPEEKVTLLQMTYFAFITMTTVGYGDITPARTETQTFAYLLAVTGQLYVAMLIGFIMGKFLVHQESSKKEG
jgi:voltage-gated potassium channel